jgi:hypothetical protein
MQQVIASVHNKTPFTQEELLKALGTGAMSDKEAAALHSAYKNAFDRIQTFNVAGNQGTGGFLEGFTAHLGDKNVTTADLNKWIDKWNADSTAKGKKSNAVSETRPDGSVINRWYNDADYAALLAQAKEAAVAAGKAEGDWQNHFTHDPTKHYTKVADFTKTFNEIAGSKYTKAAEPITYDINIRAPVAGKKALEVRTVAGSAGEAYVPPELLKERELVTPELKELKDEITPEKIEPKEHVGPAEIKEELEAVKPKLVNARPTYLVYEEDKSATLGPVAPDYIPDPIVPVPMDIDFNPEYGWNYQGADYTKGNASIGFSLDEAYVPESIIQAPEEETRNWAEYINTQYGNPLVYSDEALKKIKYYTVPHSRKLREAFERLANGLR